MLALLAAATTLSLTLQQPFAALGQPSASLVQEQAFLQVAPSNSVPRSSGHYVEPAHSDGERKIDSSQDAQLPRRSEAWIAAGAFGMATIGAGIGGTFAEAIYRSGNQTGDYSDTRPGNRGMLLGMLLGLVPGLLFGNEARNESNGLGRQVVVLLGLGGAVATGIAAASIRSAH